MHVPLTDVLARTIKPPDLELTLHESQDLLILLFGLTLFHQVDLILQDQDVL